MGQQYDAVCKDCGHGFTVREGGGFFFHLLHCDRCGDEKSMTFDEVSGPHLQYLNGLDLPYSAATKEWDKQILETYSGEPISENEYHKAVENLAGECGCGGQYKLDARPRCPVCRSTEMEMTGASLLYD